MADAQEETVQDSFGSMAIFVTACAFAVLCTSCMAMCAYRCTKSHVSPSVTTTTTIDNAPSSPYRAPKFVQPPPPPYRYAVVDHPDGQRALAMTRPRADKKMCDTQKSSSSWAEV